MGFGYARVKKRTGGLADALSPVLDHFEKKRKEEEKKKFYDTMLSAYNQYLGEVNNPVMTVDKDKGVWEKLTSVPQQTVTPTTEKEYDKPYLLPEKPKPPEVPLPQESELSDYILPDARVDPKQRYEKAIGSKDKFMQELMTAILNPKIERDWVGDINPLARMVEGKTESLKPKDPSYFTLGSGSEHYRINADTGEIELVAGNPPERNYDKINNPKTGTIWYYDKDGMTGYDTGIPYERDGKGYSKGTASGGGADNEDGAASGGGADNEDGAASGGGADNKDKKDKYYEELGRLNSGIKAIENLFHGTLWTVRKDAKGNKFYTPPKNIVIPGTTGEMEKKVTTTTEAGLKREKTIPVEFTEEEYRALKEGVKANYLDDAESLIHKNKLSEEKAHISDGIKVYQKEYPNASYFDAAMWVLEEADKEWDLPPKEKEILRQYFKFLGL